MKVSVLVSAVAASLAFVAPVKAQDSAVFAECVKSFVAGRFEGQPTTVRFEREYSPLLPLMLRRQATQMKLVATDKQSGRMLATAMCSNKSGVVVVEEIRDVELIAAR